MNAYPFSEARLAEATGLAAGLFRTARKKMARGVDWETEKKATVYSVTGFYKALDLLKVEASPLELARLQREALAHPDAGTRPSDAPKPSEGVVERFFLNRFLLGVRIGTELVKMRVGRGRELYRKGMKVQLRPVAKQAYWEPVGGPPGRSRR